MTPDEFEASDAVDHGNRRVTGSAAVTTGVVDALTAAVLGFAGRVAAR